MAIWESFLLGLAIFAILHGLRSAERPGVGRRFWYLLALALGFRLTAVIGRALGPAGEPGFDLWLGGLWAVSYLILILVAEKRPDLEPSETDPKAREELYSAASAAAFVLALLAYTVAIPRLSGGPAHEHLAIVFHLSLVLFLGARFAHLAGVATRRRWRVVYGYMFAAFGLASVIEAWRFIAAVAPSLPFAGLGRHGTVLELIPLGLILAAVRARALPESEAAPAGGEGEEAAAWDPLAFYALVFPFLHLLLDFSGQLEYPSRLAQQALVLVYFVSFGALALIQNARREERRLVADKQRIAAEKAAERNSRLASLGRFSAAMAHKIRNPLAALVMHCFFLDQHLPARDEESRQTLEDIQAAVRRMQKLVDGILGFVRPSQIARAPEDFGAVIEAALGRLRSAGEPPCEIRRELEHRHALVELDAAQLAVVFDNLFANALRAMPDGGTLTVATRNPDAATLEVVGADTGDGIDAEDLERVFEPFFGRRDDGVGLGLAVVARILDQHDCRYRLESEPGRGTRFILSFALADRPGKRKVEGRKA